MVTGVTGQDGSLAASLCLSLGLNVVGVGRKKIGDTNLSVFDASIRYFHSDYSVGSLEVLLDELKPAVILNFAGQSNATKSWALLEETTFSQITLPGNFLAAIEKVKPDCYFLNACSSEIFGGLSPGLPASIDQKFLTPYAVAQRAGFEMVKVFRDVRNHRASNAIFYNHESILRPTEFVFKKVISSASRCAKRQANSIALGNLDVVRDWGYAPEYIIIALIIALQGITADLPICSGVGISVFDMADCAFGYYDLNVNDFLQVDPDLCRKNEIAKIVGDTGPLIRLLGTAPKYGGENLIEKICDDYERRARGESWIDWNALLTETGWTFEALV